MEEERKGGKGERLRREGGHGREGMTPYYERRKKGKSMRDEKGKRRGRICRTNIKLIPMRLRQADKQTEKTRNAAYYIRRLHIKT